MACGMSRLPRKLRLWAKRMNRIWFGLIMTFDFIRASPSFGPGIRAAFKCFGSIMITGYCLPSCHLSYMHGVEDVFDEEDVWGVPRSRRRCVQIQKCQSQALKSFEFFVDTYQ